MALPPTIRVKLSSEAAESISLTPVVVQELPIGELVGHLLAVTGKDEPRIREILQRGTLVSGASRFRWAGWDPDMDGLRQVLAGFPDPDPARPFAPARCVRVSLKGGRQPVEIARETAGRKGLLARRSFWDGLMDVIGAQPAVYAGYSYRDRADRYIRDLSLDEARRIREESARSKFSILRDQVRGTAFTQAEMLAERV
jgi:hypothetical protein